jgi:putative membrane protein
MQIVAKILIGLIALEHIYFLVLEMFLWTTPRTRATFGMSEQMAEATKVLAANQGLYNGFLAAGLAWSLIAPAAYATQIAMFFLGCVVVAGLYGGYSVGTRILLVQALPAAIALAVVLYLRSRGEGLA